MNREESILLLWPTCTAASSTSSPIQSRSDFALAFIFFFLLFILSFSLVVVSFSLASFCLRKRLFILLLLFRF